MRKSLLNLYMQKVAEGDKTYVDRLCKQLSDRLVFAPVTSSPAAGGRSGKATFSVLRQSQGNRSIVPIFTSEKRFKEWSEKRGHSSGSISLLGGDFCAALGDQTWVSVDSGFEEGVELEPAWVGKISQTGLSDDSPQGEIGQEREPIEERAHPQPETAAPRGFVKNAMFSSAPADEYVNLRDRLGPNSNVPGPKSSSSRLDASDEDLDQQAAVGSKLIRSAIFSNAPEAAGDYQVQKALEKSGLTESSYSDKKKSTLAGASLYSGDASSAVPTESEHAADAAADEEDSKAPKKKKSFLSFLKGG